MSGSGGLLDIDDPDDVVRYATQYSGLLTGMLDHTSAAVSGIGVPGGSSAVDHLGTSMLNWLTTSIDNHATAAATTVRAATQGVVVGAQAIGTTDTGGGSAVSATVEI